MVRLHLHRTYLRLAIAVSPTNWPIQKLNHLFIVASPLPQHIYLHSVSVQKNLYQQQPNPPPGRDRGRTSPCRSSSHRGLMGWDSGDGGVLRNFPLQMAPKTGQVGEVFPNQFEFAQRDDLRKLSFLKRFQFSD